MGEFHQHPDGHVYVRGDNGTHYVDSRDNFVKDFGVELPPLPAGADDHVYTQSKRHAYMGNGSVIDGGPMPWPEGDQIIGNLTAGLASQNARKQVAQPDFDMGKSMSQILT